MPTPELGFLEQSEEYYCLNILYFILFDTIVDGPALVVLFLISSLSLFRNAIHFCTLSSNSVTSLNAFIHAS